VLADLIDNAHIKGYKGVYNQNFLDENPLLKNLAAEPKLFFTFMKRNL